jgi:hypothetical protein
MTIVLDSERVRAYREATGDTLPLYDAQGAVPPLAVAAFALGALLESVGLPPGTLHANESLQARQVVPAGSSVQCNARIAQRSQRGGWVVTVLESDLTLNDQSAVFARATVLCPADQ